VSIFDFFRRKPTATIARDRLQILLAHERSSLGKSDLIAKLQEEIIAVIRKHLEIDPDKVMLKLENGDHVSTLEIDIEVPLSKKAKVA
jgi:cell division topological specificity factor